MSFRKTAFWLGLFALVMGIITYDKEVATSPVPIVTGLLVIILAVTGLLPEFTKCVSCGKKILKKWDTCRFCGAGQGRNDSKS